MAMIRFFVSLTACVLILAAGAGAQELPPLFGPDGSPPDSDIIQARVTHWVNQIKTGEEASQIIDARKKLITECGRLEDSSLRSRYAIASGQGLLPVLTEAPAEEDALGALREINAVMAAAKMNQFGASDVLAAAITHTNPAVRLWGWRGYAAILDRVLAQGETTSGVMFSVLEDACKTEPSALVRGAMYDLMTLPAVRSDLVSDGAWAQTALRLEALLLSQWADHCSRILAGQTESLETAGQAIKALESLSSITKGTPASTAILQAMADLLWASYGAYNDATEGDVAIPLGGGIMLNCEAALRRMSSLNEERLKVPLTATKIPGMPGSVKDHATRSSFVGQAVVDWIKALKDNHAIKDPDVKPFGEPVDEEGDAETDSGE
jgi:hypothetical protein